MNPRRIGAAAAFAALLLPAAARAQDASPPPDGLHKGDALLVRIQGVGGGIPEYREVVDSEGRIEIPFLGYLAAEGKSADVVAAEMADSYLRAGLATNAEIRFTYVTHFEPPPARTNLIRIQDPRRPVP